MRYHFEKPEIYLNRYGETYICDHPVYNRCTLFKIGDRGLAVIQQRFDPEKKATYWTEIDPWLTDAIYLNPNFKSFFDNRASTCDPGNETSSYNIYTTVTVRQIICALKMKPLKREPWETVFDRKDI